jgi:transcriptional regulator with XRE-family HTH domain
MPGHKKWSEIRAKAAPETLARADALLASYRLRELREARGLTQAEMAERLEIRQVSVSKMEARSDVHVSTLRSVIEALGGRMEIRAVFPDAEYVIEVGDEMRVHSPEPSGKSAGARDAA